MLGILVVFSLTTSILAVVLALYVGIRVMAYIREIESIITDALKDESETESLECRDH